tara:strand:- start:39 stop:296 length:258 start_codon:yes stop_codon:yes gene_type:complete
MVITKKDLIKIIKEELEYVLEVAPQTGVYSVSKQNIAMAKRIEKMYRDAGLTKKADIFARAIEQGESGEIDYEQFSRMLDSASEV